MDDLYPNDGSYYQPEAPIETQTANAEEKKKAEEAIPFIDGVLKWFDATVKTTDSVAFAVAMSRQYDKPIEEVVVALDICRQYLEQKKGELESLARTLK